MNRIYFTRRHRLLEIISYVPLAISFILAIIAQKTLPAQIPVHYDLSGKVTEYGSPAILFLLPGTMLFVNLIMSFIAHFVSVDHWNMPFKVRPEKKIIVYRDIVSMMLWMEMEFAVYTFIYTIMSYIQKMDGVMLLSILLMLIISATIIGFCILAAKHNKGR